MKKAILLGISIAIILSSCGSGGTGQKSEKSAALLNNQNKVKLITLDPGHFHAALVQKIMYDNVSPDVHVYAPEGPDYLQHLDKIKSYNIRSEDPTSWNEIIYTGNDFIEKMLAEKAGNVVVISGNNRKKADYISKSIDAGFNVLADKPMIIFYEDYPKLVDAFNHAREKNLLLYDIMSERYEVTTILQKMVSQKEEIFGKLTAGTSKEPAISMISVHNFSKIVSGTPLIRPAWFFDVNQQGEGIVDVSTHLIDLVQWEGFPEQIINPEDINLIEAKRWPTILSKEEFKGVTGLDNYPDFLMKDVKDKQLDVFANGDILYKIKGIWARVTVKWNYEAPTGGGDTHHFLMHGTLCDLVIRQDVQEHYLPTLYIENVRGMSMDVFIGKLKNILSSLPYDSLQIESVDAKTLRINVPDKYRVGEEAYFGQVTEKFLGYLKTGKLPEWEVAGMITKYYITTEALKMAKGIK